MFLIILAILFLIGWVLSALALLGWPILYVFYEHDKDLILDSLAVGSFLLGFGLIVLLLAAMTGELKAEGRADGCYYAHTALIGKVIVQSWTPIPCSGTVN